ncbi:MAG: YlzJ-like family protein [Clostridiales bacterium]
MIWSIMPEELIFQKPDQALSAKTVSYRGKQLVIVPQEDGKARIKSIISSDPQDFLNTNLLPGTIIEAWQ